MRTKKLIRKKNVRLFTLFVVTVLIMVLYVVSMQNQNASVDIKTLRPLMDLIAKAESNDNYNAYFGNASKTSLRLTEMTISDAQKWQADYISDGSPSSAVGRYQIISMTLDGLVRELAIDTNKQFDEAMQDRLAIALLDRRGAIDYANNRITAERFAANLAMEWAALPRMIGKNPNSSYYSGDGLNQSRASVDELLKAVRHVQPS